MDARTFLSRPLLLSLGSAFLYIALSDFPAYAWPLGLAALAPFFLFLHRESSLQRVFWYGSLFGTIAVAGTIVWFLGTYPLEWTGVENHLAAAVIVFSVWTFTSMFLGMFFGLFAFLFKKLSRGDSRDIIVVSSIWVLMEFTRAFALSLVFLGAQSSLGPDWIFGFFGYSLGWSHLFALLAPLGGVYFVSFVGVAINYGIFMLLFQLRHKNVLALLVGLVAFIGSIYGADQIVAHARAGEDSPNATAVVAIVTTNFPAAFADGFSRIAQKSLTIENLLSTAVLGDADIIVLPEDSRALSYLGATRVQSVLDKSKKEVLLIDSSRSLDSGEPRAKILFYSSSERAVSGESDKEFLMPFGEYIPYIAVGIARAFGQEAWVSSFNEVREYERGKVQTYSFQGHALGALFCSEIIPDAPYRDLAIARANIFLNVASHADFHENGRTLYNQTLSTAKMKAASHRRYFIQAGNYMPSFLLNEKGDVVAESVSAEQGVLFVKVGFNTEETPYTRFGNWILLIAFVVFIWRAGRGCAFCNNMVSFR